jgi:hypothetical protein
MAGWFRAEGAVSRGGSSAGGGELGDPPGDAGEPLKQDLRRASADAAAAAAAAAEVSVRAMPPPVGEVGDLSDRHREGEKEGEKEREKEGREKERPLRWFANRSSQRRRMHPLVEMGSDGAKRCAFMKPACSRSSARGRTPEVCAEMTCTTSSGPSSRLTTTCKGSISSTQTDHLVGVRVGFRHRWRLRRR